MLLDLSILFLYEVFKVQYYRHFCLNGDGEIRTLDPLLARQVLSQLSYAPIYSGSLLLSRAVSSRVSSAGRVLTIVFGMGTGVSPCRIATGNIFVIQFMTPKYISLITQQ